MTARKRLFVPIGIIIIIILGGSLGYMVVEDYTFFQGLYMSAITISTVGYGEVVPLSPAGQGFSIVLIGCSIVGLGFAGRAVGESLLENTWSGRTEKRKMQRKIQALNGHHILCGFGRVGQAAANQLTSAKAPFVVLDQQVRSDSDTEPNQTDLLFIEGDATREKILLDAGIKKAKGLLALLGSDPENVFLVLTARELNPMLRIIARANDPNVENKLQKAGADHVISPFVTAGTQIANEILLSTGHHDLSGTAVSVDTTPQWISTDTDNSLVGMRVDQAADHLKIAVLGIRRGRRDYLMPSEDEPLKAGDSLLALPLGSSGDHAGLAAANKDIVIIDDNPVITKLYTRLFQKAGFIPHTASDGLAGLELIEMVCPTAAVIDFMLPVLSGIGVCAKVRKQEALNDTRLILFTADNNASTRERALKAGADAVVVKSPDAHEVIKTALEIISEKKDAPQGES